MSKIRRKNALSAFIHLTTHKVTHIFPYNYYKQCVFFPHHPHFSPISPKPPHNHPKTWAYDGKNVESVAYFLNNSQICKEQYSRTLGTTTTVTINNGTQVWRLIGEDEKGQPTNIGFGSLTQQLSFDLVGRVTGRKVRYGNF